MYIVWDVDKSTTLWRQDGYDGAPGLYPPLAEWIDKEGYVTIHEPVVAGCYRVFGLECNHAKTEYGSLALQIDHEAETLRIIDRSSTEVVHLKYEGDSGDWAVASFSDDGNVVAVVEPHYVTFFGRLAARG